MKATIGRIVSTLVAAAFLNANAATPSKSDATSRLDAFMNGLQSLQAEFRQLVRDGQGRSVEESSGTLALSRPNRFRWDYQKPHEQVIVADGEKLWIYDPDLEQVTVRSLDRSLAGTPAMLLSGAGDLRDSFDVRGGEHRSGIDWVNLNPKRPDTDFKSVRLGFRGDGLAGMELVDKLGQTTVLQFSRVERNPKLSVERFAFTPPQGADVIGEDTEQPKPK